MLPLLPNTTFPSALQIILHISPLLCFLIAKLLKHFSLPARRQHASLRVHCIPILCSLLLICVGPFQFYVMKGTIQMTKTLILVRYWDNHLGKPITRLLDMPVCNLGTAENLFSHINSAFLCLLAGVKCLSVDVDDFFVDFCDKSAKKSLKNSKSSPTLRS